MHRGIKSYKKNGLPHTPGFLMSVLWRTWIFWNLRLTLILKEHMLYPNLPLLGGVSQTAKINNKNEK